MPTFHLKVNCTNEEILDAEKLLDEVLGEEMTAVSKRSSVMDGSGVLNGRFRHLIIIDADRQKVVGVFRMCMGFFEAGRTNFDTEKMFDLEQIKQSGPGMVLDVEQPCIHKNYRCRTILNLMWRRLVQYASEQGIRYILSRSWLSGADTVFAYEYFHKIKRLGYFHDLGVTPLGSHDMLPMKEVNNGEKPEDIMKELPIFFQAYLNMGLKICSRPAVDPNFPFIFFLWFRDLCAAGGRNGPIPADAKDTEEPAKIYMHPHVT